MSSQNLLKSANNIIDSHMRFVLKNFATELIAMDKIIMDVKEEVSKPAYLKTIEDNINSKIAQNTVSLNQMINQKFNEFNDVISKYVQIFDQFTKTDNTDINKQMIDIMKLIDNIESRLTKLETTKETKTKEVKTIKEKKPTKKTKRKNK